GLLRDATAELRKGAIDRDKLRAIEKAVSTAGREVAGGSRLEAALRDEGEAASKGGEMRLAPRDTVFVPKLPAHAEVIEAPARGQVRVAAGAMKLTLGLDEVAPKRPGARPMTTKGVKPPKRNDPPVRRDATPVRTDSITCDVRGTRVDEAIERVEGFV